MSSFNDMINNITPDIYESLKLAVEIGKWSDGGKLTAEQRELSLQGSLTDEQRQRLLGIADRCPVHRTLHSEVKVRTALADP